MATQHYSRRKARHLLHSCYRWWRKNSKSLTPPQKQQLEGLLAQTDEKLHDDSDTDGLTQVCQQLEAFASCHMRKGVAGHIRELALAILIALALATLIRQTWFEPYEIPTGSMRPSFEEQDRLLVTKTAFGLNIPLITDHFFFHPALVTRSDIVIWSGDNMPIADNNTTYFGLFPAKKRYIKRCMGKPGDTLYFYGGKIYGIDKEGQPLTELLKAPWLDRLEWVPFITFEGEVTPQGAHGLLFHQMHLPIGRLTLSPTGTALGEIYNGTKWITDEPTAQKKPHSSLRTYSDFWGIGNYAMARLLTPEQFAARSDIEKEGIEQGLLYLELRHTPSLNYSQARFFRSGGDMGLELASYTAVIPLQRRHLEALMAHMYTARFVVRAEKAERYAIQMPSKTPKGSPILSATPDGTYEFYFGKATEIGWGAIAHPVPPYSQLYSHDPLHVQKLFNLGIEWNMAYDPQPERYAPFPHRYAYFRDGALFLLGGSIFKSDDPTLQAFIKREMHRQELSSSSRPYISFQDRHPPLKEDGSFDLDFLHTFGLKIPDDQYLMLGDNHAMSGDSRVFGFVPQANIQGAPTWIIWPVGDRLGRPPQPPLPLVTGARMTIWAIVSVIAAAYIWHRVRLRRPLDLPRQKK